MRVNKAARTEAYSHPARSNKMEDERNKRQQQQNVDGETRCVHCEPPKEPQQKQNDK